MRTLHTYIGNKQHAYRALRWLRDRSVLSEVEKIKHGHYRFVMHVPTKWTERDARANLATALRDVDYEPFVWTETAPAPIEAQLDALCPATASPPPANAPVVDMRAHIRERCELAQTYADDGAYASAARVLREIAAETQAHADFVYGELSGRG